MKRERELPVSLQWLLRACLALLAGEALLAFVLFPPYWGPMDDASLITGTIPLLETRGFFPGIWAFAQGDLRWGMFRPLYPAMAYLLYEPGLLLAPWVTFFLNALFVIGLLVGLARAFSRALGMPWPALLLGMAVFPRTYDLFQHPSLQEKLVLLFGWLLILASQRAPRAGLFPACVPVAVLGFLSKASFLVYFIPGFLFFLSRLREEILQGRPRARAEAAALAGIGLVGVAASALVARHGVYTSQFSLTRVPPNLGSLSFWMLALPALVSVCAALRFRSLRKSALLEQAPAAGILVFLVLFLPWGFAGYLQSLAAPLLAPLVMQLWDRWLPVRPRNALVGLLACLAVAVGAYRFPTIFLRLYDLGLVIREWDALAGRGARVSLPCMEGADSLRALLQRETGHAVEVRYHPGLPEPQSEELWLFDSALCPFPGGVLHPPGCREHLLFYSLWPKGYRLARLDCRG